MGLKVMSRLFLFPILGPATGHLSYWCILTTPTDDTMQGTTGDLSQQDISSAGCAIIDKRTRDILPALSCLGQPLDSHNKSGGELDRRSFKLAWEW